MTKRRLQEWMAGPNFRLFLISSAVGLVFTMVVYSPGVLNPTNVDWAMKPGTDTSAHYSGWHVFQHEPWHYPLGHMDSVLAPYGTSVSMTDSIPLFAFVFKLLQPVLPYDFQYFGWFVVMCYALQYYFGALILRRYLKNSWGVYLGAGFFLLSPVMMWRVFDHTALSAHFIILAGIYLFLQNQYDVKSFGGWTALLITALLIHPYIMAMGFILFCGYLLNYMLGEKKLIKPLGLLVGNTLLILMAGQVIGLFGMYAPPKGFGMYSFNLNALINGMGKSRLMIDRPVMEYQYEGFMYLGMAVIIMTVCAFMLRSGCFKPARSKKIYGMFAITAVVLFLALTNKVYLGTTLLFEYTLPKLFMDAIQAFQASARFFWILYYFILAYVVVSFARIFEGQEKRLVACMLAMLALQTYDLSPMIGQKKTRLGQTMPAEETLQSAFWDQLGGYYDTIVIAPYNAGIYVRLIDVLLRNGLKTNIALTSRIDADLVYGDALGHLDSMQQGKGDIRTLYILPTEELEARPEIARLYHVLEIDGQNICIDKRYLEFVERLKLTNGQE